MCIYIFVVCVVCPCRAQGPAYSIKAIDPPLRGYISGAGNIDINNRGQVVGGAAIRINNRFYAHAFLWDAENGTEDLGVLPYASISIATAINDQGQIVGWSDISHPDHHAFIWTEASGMQDLGTLTNPRPGFVVGNSEAYDINNYGEIVGESQGSGFWLLYSPIDPNNGSFSYRTVPPSVENGSATTFAINDRGEIVGVASTTNFQINNGTARAFIYNIKTGQKQHLGVYSPSHTASEASAINNMRQIVGYSYGGGEAGNTFLWQNNAMFNLGSFLIRNANSLNNSGEIVEESQVWNSTNGWRDLNNLIPANSGWRLISMRAINDRGQIVGQGLFNEVSKGVLLTPTDAAVSGWVTLEDCVQPVQTITAEFRPQDGGQSFTRTYTVNALGFFCFRYIPPALYSVRIKGTKWLAKTVIVDARNGNPPDLYMTLLAGDANNDNSVDVFDLDQLIQAFNTTPNSPHWNENADFDCDESVDVFDLDILIRNFNTQGDP
jgi:probable HAF family extracellular repeat protein